MTRTHIRGPVLAATDLSDSGAEALRQADAVAADLGTKLIVCHVLPELFNVRMLFPQHAGSDSELQPELERNAWIATSAHVTDTIGRPPAEVSIVIDAGSPHSCILSQAEQTGAGLIVLGSGEAALRVARYAPCPVLVARPSPTGGNVLGATDFSDPSLPAVEAAVAEARRRAARLSLIHCIDVPAPAMVATPGISPIPPLPHDAMRQIEAAARARLAESLKRFGADGTSLVSYGLAADAIVEAAHRLVAALVVVGTRGRTGLPRLLLGSVAEGVIGRAPCSVLVVHLTTGDEHERDRAA